MCHSSPTPPTRHYTRFYGDSKTLAVVAIPRSLPTIHSPCSSTTSPAPVRVIAAICSRQRKAAFFCKLCSPITTCSLSHVLRLCAFSFSGYCMQLPMVCPVASLVHSSVWHALLSSTSRPTLVHFVHHPSRKPSSSNESSSHYAT